MVFASRPVVSESRLAARPVGAQRATRTPLARSTARIDVHERRLADAGSAGDDEELGSRGQAQRLGLHGRERHAQPLLGPGDCALDVDRGPRDGARSKRAHAQGNLPLGCVEPGQEDGRLAVDGVGHHRARRDLELQRLLDERLGDLEQPRGRLVQVGQRQAAVPVVHRLDERVADARPGADHRRALDAQAGGDPVGAEEPDAADIGRQAVGVLADDRDCFLAVGLEDADGARGTDAVRVQEHHQLADALLRAPGLGDARRAGRPDPLDVAQPRWARAR